jgi:hypothetical protein
MTSILRRVSELPSPSGGGNLEHLDPKFLHFVLDAIFDEVCGIDYSATFDSRFSLQSSPFVPKQAKHNSNVGTHHRLQLHYSSRIRITQPANPDALHFFWVSERRIKKHPRSGVRAVKVYTHPFWKSPALPQNLAEFLFICTEKFRNFSINAPLFNSLASACMSHATNSNSEREFCARYEQHLLLKRTSVDSKNEPTPPVRKKAL